MNKLRILCLFMILFLPSIGYGFEYSPALIERLQKAVETPELKVVLYTDVHCSFYEDRTLSQISRSLTECGYYLRQKIDFPITKVFIYKTSTITKADVYHYTRLDFDVLSFVERYFPRWTVQSDPSVELSTLMLPSGWKPVSMKFLSEFLKTLNLTSHIIAEAKVFSVARSVEALSTGELYYGLFYPFYDLNRDFYELAKGYFSKVKIVRYFRDGKTYMIFSEPAKSREDCVKTFIYLKGILDDKWEKSQKLGDYFPLNERKNLQLLYQLLSDTEVKPFYPNELSYLKPSVLVSLGLDRYKLKLQHRKSISTKASKSTAEPADLDKVLPSADNSTKLQ